MSISTLIIWTACLIVTFSFPFLLQNLGPSQTFWMYARYSAGAFLFVLLVIPETKGRSLEEIEKSWHKQT